MVITGNRLQDGAVVWRNAAGNWSPQFIEAAIYHSKDRLAEGLNAARLDEAEGRIIGVYEAELDENGAQPLRLRERIRAGGPTVPCY